MEEDVRRESDGVFCVESGQFIVLATFVLLSVGIP